MYASAVRYAKDLMVDDHLKIGENGLLYRIHSKTTIRGTGWIALELYHAGDDTHTIVATLTLAPFTNVKAYNQ